MRALSNNRSNAIGPWYVNANNAPSNANANNWGARTPTHCGFTSVQKPQRMVLNQPLIKNASGDVALPRLGLSPRCVSQSPLIKRGLVGCKQPLEETRAEKDAEWRAAA